jgi:nucleoside-diphosphate-sugar epimerase
MRILLAGADGAIGTLLTPALVARGHEVVGLIHDPAGAAGVQARERDRSSPMRSKAELAWHHGSRPGAEGPP